MNRGKNFTQTRQHPLRAGLAHFVRSHLLLLMLLLALMPAILLGWLLWSEYYKPVTILEQIQEKGRLVVATRYSPATYFHGPDGPTGPEHDLISAFADRIGVKAEFIIPEEVDDMLMLVETGEADIAAAGLTILPERLERVDFSPSYLSVSQLLVTHEEVKLPKSIEELTSGVLQVIADSSHEQQLELLKASNRFKLPWKTTDKIDSEHLLHRVHNRVIDFTVLDSNEYAFYKSYYPHLKSAFELSEPQPVAWALRKRKDDSLFKAIEEFFQSMRKEGSLKRLKQRYYEHVDKLSELDTDTFWKRVENRLPEFQPVFMEIAERFGIDWHLLAAVGYQESHWNPDAVSPTGVRGLMMLTTATAKETDISDRTDPAQSILGAARYLQWLDQQLPDSLHAKDRIWFTLAAYNVGMGHLEDARVLTQRAGFNPDSWFEVRKHLPLLGKKRWYSTVRHGYARGHEPVTYVDNIRNFYDLLRWHSNSEGSNGTPLMSLSHQSDDSSSSLSIDK